MTKITICSLCTQLFRQTFKRHSSINSTQITKRVCGKQCFSSHFGKINEHVETDDWLTGKAANELVVE